MRGANPLVGTAPHPDHFDPTKFDRNGNRVGVPKGRPAKLTREQAEQAAFLELIARTAARDLTEYLVELGYETPAKQSELVTRLRRGWRPCR